MSDPISRGLMGAQNSPRQKPGAINRFQKITESLQNGYNITKVSIPSYHIADDVVVYEVDVSNKKLRWNLWLRYESFYLLHQMMLELVSELSTPETPIFLPPFPEKRLKILVDHFDEEFIEQRRMLLENYLQKLLANKCLKHSEIYISFLTPPENEEFEVTSNTVPRATQPQNTQQQQQQHNPTAYTPPEFDDVDEKMSAAERHASMDAEERDMLGNETEDLEPIRHPSDEINELTEEDEITGVAVPQAQVLKNDHTIYQIHVENINKRQSFAEWTVLKRYGEFYQFDDSLRQAYMAEHPEARNFHRIPRLPPKRMKVVVDHLDQTFIEKRRLLLQCYLKRLVRDPTFRRHDLTLNFLGVA